MNFIFEELFIQLAVKTDLHFFQKELNSANIKFYTALVTSIFAAIYLLFEVSARILKKGFILIVSASMDFIILALAIFYFFRIIIAMKSAPGEAGFGFILLPIPIVIIPFCIFSIKAKIYRVS